MGYRNYIYVVEKEKAEAVRHKSLNELKSMLKDPDYLSCYDIRDLLEAKCAIELGKYVDFDVKPYITPFFTSNEVHEKTNEEEEFVLLDPSTLQTMATFYKNKSKNYFKKLLKQYEDDKETGGALLFKELETRVAFMDDLDFVGTNKFNLCDTWLIDYDLLNFIYLMKTVDFDKYYLIWMGW